MFGGNWDLEYSTGEIETVVAFSMDVQQNWGHLLNVTIDATSTGIVTSGTLSTSFSHTTSGEDGLMLVGISFGQGKGNTVATVTYNGDALIREGFQENVSAGSSRMEIWSLVVAGSRIKHRRRDDRRHGSQGCDRRRNDL